MITLEFEGMILPGARLSLPPEVVEKTPAGEPLRVVVMWESQDADRAWRATGRRAFESAYSAEDAVYDSLINDTCVRRNRPDTDAIPSSDRGEASSRSGNS